MSVERCFFFVLPNKYNQTPNGCSPGKLVRVPDCDRVSALAASPFPTVQDLAVIHRSLLERSVRESCTYYSTLR
jgi:hypothetical protein